MKPLLRSLPGEGAVDVIMGAGLVCHSWLDAAKTPELWREVDMGRGPRDKQVMGKNSEVMCAMAKAAVDRSDGKLEVFVVAHFVTDEILSCIAARSPSLKRLALASCDEVTCDGLIHLVNKCPLLEDIEFSGCKNATGYVVVAAGRACPGMKRLVLDKPWRRKWDKLDAAGISMMRELRHLRISRSEIRNEELMAVVDACPLLEHLSVKGKIRGYQAGREIAALGSAHRHILRGAWGHECLELVRAGR